MAEDEPNRTGWQWNARKEKAALMLAEGKTWEVVKKELAVSSSTLAEWKKSSEFQARIDEHHDVIVAEARRILRRNATVAANKVVQIAEAGYGQHAVKLSASKDILDRVGVRAPEKLALTDPTGEHEYSGLSDRELTAKLISLLDAARTRASGEADT